MKAFKQLITAAIIKKYWAGNTSYFLFSETMEVSTTKVSNISLRQQLFSLRNTRHLTCLSTCKAVKLLILATANMCTNRFKCREEAPLSLLVQSITLKGQCTSS